MGRSPCCDKANVKKGLWSPEEDSKLKEFIEKFGTGGNWIALPQKAGLRRCGKSCRLRWLNYLRPNIKHGEFSDEENRIICTLYASIGSRWSIIAAQLPGRTDNNIKNYWNTKLKKKLLGMMIPSHQENFSQSFPGTLQTESQTLSSLSQSYGDYNSFYGHASNSLTPSESISTPQNLPHHGSESFSLSTNQYSYYHQDQEGLVDLQCCPWTDYNNNMLMFGGNEASCSSSDGNYSQTSNGKDNLKQEEMGCLQDLVSNGTEEDQNSMILYGKFPGDYPVDPFLDQKPFGIFERGLLQSDAEEVKRLTGSCNGRNSNNNYDLFFKNENPTDVLREMFYR